VMARSVLSQTTELLVADFSAAGTADSDHSLRLWLDSDGDSDGDRNRDSNNKQRKEQIELLDLEVIGMDPVGFLMDFIAFKEDKLGVSSCFMYHAAYSMPQPLLYANEILCVLIGAKPLTMVSDCCISSD
jgi:hypothetical protein